MSNPIHSLSAAWLRATLVATVTMAAAAAMAAGCGGDDGDDAPDDGGPDGPDGGGSQCELAAPWGSAPALPLGATQETATVALGGKLYVLGGFNGASGVIAAVQVFDPATCAWSAGPPLPMTVHHVNAAVHGDTIYVVGALTSGEFRPSGVTWSWAPGRQTQWQVLPSMPAGSERGASITGVIGDVIYVAGGLRGGTVTDVSSFDVVARTWGPALPALPGSRDHACGAVVGGKLYLIGGRNSALSSAVYEYTPGGAWLEKTAMPTARAGVACGVVGEGAAARVIVVGGEGNAASPVGVFPQTEAYRPDADTWETLTPMKTPRHGMGAAAIDGKLYVPGGGTREGFGATATFEVLTL